LVRKGVVVIGSRGEQVEEFKQFLRDVKHVFNAEKEF